MLTLLLNKQKKEWKTSSVLPHVHTGKNHLNTSYYLTHFLIFNATKLPSTSREYFATSNGSDEHVSLKK